jgi:integrase
LLHLLGKEKGFAGLFAANPLKTRCRRQDLNLHGIAPASLENSLFAKGSPQRAVNEGSEFGCREHPAMARQTDGPWFRASKETWYATVDGKSVSLSVKGDTNRAEAFKAWHRLMAGLPTTPTEPPQTVVKPRQKPEESKPRATVQGVIDAFLTDGEGRMTAGCLRNYRIYLNGFAANHGERQADCITPTEAEAYARKGEWSDTYRANFLNCLRTLYRWAVRQGLVAVNPVEHVRKPTKKSRGVSAVISETEHRRLLAVSNELMRDYLTVLWLTGARPGEVAGLTAEQVRSATNGVIPLYEHKTAHKGKARFLILTEEALSILKRRAETVDSGLLFAGRDGELTAQAIGSRMRTLCNRAGIRRLTVYGYRHGFATDALANGVPDATVAALLGHSSTAMLHKHYSHLTARADVLRKAIGQVR